MKISPPHPNTTTNKIILWSKTFHSFSGMSLNMSGISWIFYEGLGVLGGWEIGFEVKKKVFLRNTLKYPPLVSDRSDILKTVIHFGNWGVLKKKFSCKYSPLQIPKSVWRGGIHSEYLWYIGPITNQGGGYWSVYRKNTVFFTSNPISQPPSTPRPS